MEKSKEKEEINLKILLVGDSGVGKTSFLIRYVNDEFPDKHITTVAIDHLSKVFKFRGFKVQLHIWDTAGQERYRSIVKNFFHNTDGILFLYDITSQKSFTGVKAWIKESEHIDNSFKKVLIGNKCDLNYQKNVSEEEVKKYCEENKIDHFEASAKNDINIKEALRK